MTVKLLTKPHLEFLSFERGCTGPSEYTLVKMPHSWKSRVTAQIYLSLQSHSHLRQHWFIYQYSSNKIPLTCDTSKEQHYFSPNCHLPNVSPMAQFYRRHCELSYQLTQRVSICTWNECQVIRLWSNNSINRKNNSRIRSSLGCMLGVLLCMKRLHFVRRNWRKKN